MQAAETKKKMEALSAIGKQAPRLGEGVRIVRQHNKQSSARLLDSTTTPRRLRYLRVITP